MQTDAHLMQQCTTNAATWTLKKATKGVMDVSREYAGCWNG
jgi:hypothetical protein